MKKVLAIILTLALLLTGCGASSAPSSSNFKGAVTQESAAMDMAPMESPAAMEEIAYETGSGNSLTTGDTGSAAIPDSRKWIITMDMSVETEDLDAMLRELERGGQVYYLHNRTETIDKTVGRLRSLLGEEVRIAAAHGKMDQEQLGDIMSQMTEGEIDILVCTTIIETGVDLPNVNTLIIENAERFGLSQLHQLRGRVGRSARRAFAYLTYRRS